MSGVSFTVPGEPVPFARAGSRGKVRFTPKKQSDFMGVIKLYAQRAMAGKPPIEGPVEMRIRAVYLIPESWSAKRKAGARWKDSRPDSDNLAKLCADSINTIVFKDDAQIASLSIQKVYGVRAETTVTVSPLSEAA